MIIETQFDALVDEADTLTTSGFRSLMVALTAVTGLLLFFGAAVFKHVGPTVYYAGCAACGGLAGVSIAYALVMFERAKTRLRVAKCLIERGAR